MSIATEIARLQQAKADLKASINAKGGTITDETIDEYASKVSALPSPKEEETKTLEPDFSSGNQVITPTSGKVLSQVTLTKPTDLIPENIAKDKNICGVVGTLEGGGSGVLTKVNLNYHSYCVYIGSQHRTITLNTTKTINSVVYYEIGRITNFDVNTLSFLNGESLVAETLYEAGHYSAWPLSTGKYINKVFYYLEGSILYLLFSDNYVYVGPSTNGVASGVLLSNFLLIGSFTFTESSKTLSSNISGGVVFNCIQWESSNISSTFLVTRKSTSTTKLIHSIVFDDTDGTILRSSATFTTL
jgi:hypothetical protein